ncbi:RIO-like kinase [Mycena sanguinolenta]|uniref:RIO-like kinase n=1 Tax=Mycena sanguinolenta TaxID=230812 RepID=A0A8H6WXW6_9AGAR|nr:RIO-like kinase [Mycena sanguinolenta]
MSTSTWQRTDHSTYMNFFSLPRVDPPTDITASTAMSYDHDADDRHTNTIWLRRLNVTAMTHKISNEVSLNLQFVRRVLSSHGPIVDPLFPFEWQWARRPAHVKSVVDAEQGLYPFLEWIIYRPAARAVPVVLHTLFQDASQPVPVHLAGYSRTTIIYNQSDFGSTDIIHFLSPNEDAEHTDPGIRTLHEVKRARVLATRHLNVLDEMYRLAESGWNFRQGSSTCKKGSLLLGQALDELALNMVDYIVLTTEKQYALVHLSGDSLHMSRVYPIQNSSSQQQADDMAELVLFYAHAALTRSSQPPPQPPVSIHRVSIPSFPPSIFKPSRGFIHVGGALVFPVNLSTLRRPSDGFFPQLLPLGIDGLCGHSRHDGEIIISFVQLTFFVFQAKAVAKAAYGPRASKRLRREFDVYKALRPLQGSSIPTLFGLYRNRTDGSSVLIISHGGSSLRDFDSLTIVERHSLMSHLISIHQAGVLHNDLEPRNVVISPSLGPTIIDFDNASLDHRCEGPSCPELREFAGELGIDTDLEFPTAKRVPSVSTQVIKVVLVPIMMLVVALGQVVRGSWCIAWGWFNN